MRLRHSRISARIKTFCAYVACMKEQTHIDLRPSILYFGTPVALITTTNPDGSANIGPMSSAWALGYAVILGLENSAWTLANLERHGECVINLPGPDLAEHVERLAPLTGRDPVPEHKADGYRHEPDKFGAAGLTPQPSASVEPPRIAECPLQLEARVAQVHTPSGAYADGFRIVETHVECVHASPEIVEEGTDHIDPDRWSPLLYVFRHYFGTGDGIGKTFKAEY